MGQLLKVDRRYCKFAVYGEDKALTELTPDWFSATRYPRNHPRIHGQVGRIQALTGQQQAVYG